MSSTDSQLTVVKKSKRNVTSKHMKVEIASVGDPNELPLSVNTHSVKRTHPKNGGPIPKQMKGLETKYQQPKNALVQLNELKPGLDYVVESAEGPPHNPVFVVSVKVNDKKFIGKGCSKQKAKHAAGEAALQYVLQLSNVPDTIKSATQEKVIVDLIDDNCESESADLNKAQQLDSVSGVSGVHENLAVENEINSKIHDKITQVGIKIPCVLLNEHHPGLVYTLAQEDPTCVDKRFVMTLNVDGTIFEGAGQTKKAAKTSVARAVLLQKYKVHFSLLSTSSLINLEKDLFDFSQILADKIENLVHSKVDKLVKGMKNCPKWKILAGVIMTKDEAMEDMQLICISTGMKSLKGQNMSFNGAALNDSHAEVIARRCLKDFFFTQLELHVAGNGTQSIFEKVDAKFRLKSNFKFHFYISAPPCGNASVMESSAVGYPGYGILQTKLDSINGTHPVQSISSAQKADDIATQRAAYQIMSCSDKMTIWNVLGTQGSLLNYFIEPVYFDSVIIGQFFHYSNMVYSMFKRIEHSLDKLPAAFSLHKPKITCTSTQGTRHLVKPPQISINWTHGLVKAEVVIGNTGKLVSGQVSRLAKQSLYKRFSKIYCPLMKTSASPSSDFYASVKIASPNYKQAKDVLLKAFVSNGLGTWKKKPDEQELFNLVF